MAGLRRLFCINETFAPFSLQLLFLQHKLSLFFSPHLKSPLPFLVLFLGIEGTWLVQDAPRLFSRAIVCGSFPFLRLSE